MTLRKIAGYGPALILASLLLVIWQVYVRSGQIDPHLLPAPVDILQALINNWDTISLHTMQTLLETVLGMAISTVLGLSLAIMLSLSGWIRRALYPLLIISQTIPMIALAPLLVIWVGFGIGSKLIVITIYCFFPIIVACADGLLSVDQDLLRLMKSMRASRWQVLRLVQLPGAMPSFFSGLRIAATYSVTAAIFAEFVGAESGLGVYMKLTANARAIVLVFALIVVTAVLSLLLFGFVSFIERILLPWYHGVQHPL